MERRGGFTYERLINSLGRLHGTIGAQLPDLKDAGRVRDLQQVINDALRTARAGVSGEAVPSPAQLKQDIKAHIAEIHKRHDAVDDGKAYTQSNARISAFASSAARDKHNISLPSSQQNPASKRARGTRDRSKENAVPRAVPSSQPPARNLSAVIKTTLTPRSTSSKPSTTASVKRRPARIIRSKATTQDVPATQDIPAPPVPPTDEADRRAAAAALLGLAEHSSETPFTSSLSGITPPTAGKKRAHSVYEDDVSFHHDSQSREYVDSSLTSERRVRAPAMYAPIPVLGEDVSVKQAFVMGVEYAVQHLSSGGGSEGAVMRVWVGEQVGSHNAVLLDGSHAEDGSSMDRGAVAASARAIDGGGRGFWDVV